MARGAETMKRPSSWRQAELRVLVADRMDAHLARAGLKVGADQLQGVLVVALLETGAILADDPGAERQTGA